VVAIAAPQFLNQSAPLSVSAEPAMQKTSVPTQMMKVYNLITLSTAFQVIPWQDFKKSFFFLFLF
jgi:hypothetical protein